MGSARWIAGACLAGVLATACSPTVSARAKRETADTTLLPKGPVNDRAMPVDEQRFDGMLLDADGAEPGKVKKLDNGFLVIDPYEDGVRRTRLRIPPEAPVFEGHAEVSATRLAPGADVRVYYRTPKGDEDPEAVGVVVLDPAEAKRVQQRVKHEPPPLPPQPEH